MMTTKTAPSGTTAQIPPYMALMRHYHYQSGVSEDTIRERAELALRFIKTDPVFKECVEKHDLLSLSEMAKRCDRIANSVKSDRMPRDVVLNAQEVARRADRLCVRAIILAQEKRIVRSNHNGNNQTRAEMRSATDLYPSGSTATVLMRTTSRATDEQFEEAIAACRENGSLARATFGNTLRVMMRSDTVEVHQAAESTLRIIEDLAYTISRALPSQATIEQRVEWHRRYVRAVRPVSRFFRVPLSERPNR